MPRERCRFIRRWLGRDHIEEKRAGDGLFGGGGLDFAPCARQVFLYGLVADAHQVPEWQSL